MCRKCDNLRREIAANRQLSTGLTDPSSILLMKDDIKTLEEKMIRMTAELHPVAKYKSRASNDKSA
ncbi:MAG: hypothetical protein K5821_13830 [Nitrobacter sp.]|uniref:hypothetical protein n=1 Tax=Nitrobacter sp. TaxID=29420 RepID=UPI0026177ABA|nr:hypothetical protein [Nitrobacter sp.]MCV0387481.1 hypothetical protein [Nitrobacter sp.]